VGTFPPTPPTLLDIPPPTALENLFSLPLLHLLSFFTELQTDNTLATKFPFKNRNLYRHLLFFEMVPSRVIPKRDVCSFSLKILTLSFLNGRNEYILISRS
jgi:hypothetical protein